MQIVWDNKQGDEKSETNNEATLAFIVDQPLKPDLTVTSIEINDSTAGSQHFQPGQSIKLEFLGKNIGDAASKASSEKKWWYGTSANAKTTEIATGTLAEINGLSANESEWEADASWNVPAAPGTYYLKVQMDWDDKQGDEQSETND